MRDKALRDHLLRLLDWEEAHVGFDKAVGGIPADARGAQAAGFEHSPWQLLEHIRIAQDDILDFCVNAQYEHALKWPDDYWPPTPEPPSDSAWDEALAAIRADRESLARLARDEGRDLTARIPHGTGQTYLRTVLVAVDHASYHVGQLVLVRRLLGAWPGA